MLSYESTQTEVFLSLSLFRAVNFFLCTNCSDWAGAEVYVTNRRKFERVQAGGVVNTSLSIAPTPLVNPVDTVEYLHIRVFDALERGDRLSDKEIQDGTPLLLLTGEVDRGMVAGQSSTYRLFVDVCILGLEDQQPEVQQIAKASLSSLLLSCTDEEYMHVRLSH